MKTDPHNAPSQDTATADSEHSVILLVDDQQGLRDTLGEILESESYEVRLAESYDEAVAQLDNSVDLALTDVMLEGKSGIELLSYIRDHYPNCPVILMSGYADKQNALDALRKGAVDYLEKPVDPDVLLHDIRQWLDFRKLKLQNQRLQDFQAVHERLVNNEEQIRIANERLNFLLTSTAAVIYAAGTEDFATTFISDNIARMSGHPAKTFTNDPGFRLKQVHPDDIERVRENMHTALELGQNRIEYRFRHRDGHYFWVIDEMRLERNQHGDLEFLGFLADINRRKQNEEQIRRMAYTDLLTGLPNRSLYFDRLKQAIAQARRNRSAVAVLFIDLDFFKPINDELGHEWGDQALVEVAERLRDCIREADTVARIGGDEFSIVLAEIGTRDDACLVAEKVIDRVREPMILNKRSYTLGASIGIYLESEDYSDEETFLRLADDAMYHAKQQGRNRYYVYEEHDHIQAAESDQKHELEIALRQAVALNQLLIHYQPRIDMKQNRITGLHALLRWERDEGDVVLPDQFLPAAEKSGLLATIGEWVLRQACAQSRAWRDAGVPVVPISVNITSDQLRLPNFNQTVISIMAEHGIAADMLELEISESDLMQHSMAVLNNLNLLHEIGIRITIDNFGSGFFSLQSLKSIPAQELKMSRSLIQQIGSSPDNDRIANAVISMGHILEHKVVAEGVETVEQMEFLRQHESDGMLGFLNYPPSCAEETSELLINNPQADKPEAV